MEVSLEVLVFMGVFLGVFTRAILPWIRKIHQGKLENPNFDKKYLYSAVAAAIWITGLLIKILYYFNPPNDELGAICVLLLSYFGGWYSLDFQNELGKLKTLAKKVEEAIEELRSEEAKEQG